MRQRKFGCTGFSIEWMVKYRYDDDDRDTIGHVCTVLHHALHPNDFELMLYLVSDDSTGYVYLISEQGLEFAKRKMTIAEIEKELGYRIEIVEENK